MLNFEEEIKKFKPSLEVGNIEKNMKTDNMEDLLDIIKKMTKFEKENMKNNSKG